MYEERQKPKQIYEKLKGEGNVLKQTLFGKDFRFLLSERLTKQKKFHPIALSICSDESRASFLKIGPKGIIGPKPKKSNKPKPDRTVYYLFPSGDVKELPYKTYYDYGNLR